MKKKILIALLAVLVVCAMTLALTACDKTHNCGHVCGVCGKCQDETCNDPACEDKCDPTCPGYNPGSEEPPLNPGDPDCEHTDIVLNVCQNPDCQKEFSYEEVMDKLYELASGASLQGTYKLGGTVKSIDTPYDSGYQNVTVTMTVGERDVVCFRMKGEGADKICVGSVITVSGVLKNYSGTREFDASCALLSYTVPTLTLTVDAEHATVKTPAGEDLPTSVQGGTAISFKVTAESDYRVESVKINGKAASANEEVYTFTITQNTTILVTAVPNSQPEPQQVVLQYAQGSGTSNMHATSLDNEATRVGLDPSIFTITSEKTNSGNNHVGLNNDGTLRLYKNQTATMYITIADEYVITKIEVEIASGQATIDKLSVVVGGDTISGTGSYDINAKSVALSNLDSSKQIYIQKVTIYYLTA